MFDLSRSIRCRAHCRLLVTVVISIAIVAPSAVDAAPCWRPPVDGTIADPFRQPPCVWCAGNRGLDYLVAGSTVVRAAATGRVVFAGAVVDVRYVVVRLPNGWRHTYGQLTATQLAAGDVVLAGDLIGRAVDRFFFGLRIGDDYADPAPYLGSIVGRARLVPIDGSSPRPAPTPTVRCQVRTPSR